MFRFRLFAFSFLVGAFLASAGLSAQEAPPSEVDATSMAAMRWRLVGPFRGGRSNAVAGVPGRPRTFYFGGTGGGVWKTTDGGERWRNVSDGFFGTGSVGAITVADSDPNVIYVGMGEHAVRGVTTSHGDGVYRSTDAGRTWTHVGLERTRAISRIRVHPRDPDLVYVAAQGAPYGPSSDRGIYRSRDGGAHWERIHFVSEDAGPSDLAMDPTNPRILYAAYWDHRRLPWMARSGGPGSGIWKSVDGGDTWTRLREGLPELMGKIGVTVSPANPDRLWANVEAAAGQGGVYRSDDGGTHWRQVNGDRVTQTRSWYYMKIFADPRDENTVYVLNAPMLRSVDGGATFTPVRVGHGDTHDLWIAPEDPQRMILGDDGGAEITFNGGESWSTLHNQPTAQFYRVITDNQFPYHIYGGQQDNSAIGIASAAAGGIGWKDFYSVSGCESAYLAFDPDDPRYVFGGCYQGLIQVWDRETGLSKPVMAYPYVGLGTYPRNQKYRFNWNAPIVASPHDPDVIYHAGNVLLRSTDRGQSWTEISPDLTRNEKEKQGPGGGPITNEGAGGENYNTISYVAPSPHERRVIWVGTDDGLVHLTRDEGASWSDVTPGGLGEALVNSIEVSPHDPATAWVVMTRYKFNDFTPHIFRTRDYGGHWEEVVRGIGPEDWVRVVREDPARRDMLFAGTETGMYLSFDGGDHWRPFQLNLPVVPVTDLTVHGRDLVASTQGRAFWVLDDLSPLRQATDEALAAPFHLFRPAPAVQANFSGRGGDGPGRTGENPPYGAQIFFYLNALPAQDVSVEILDGAGDVVRAYAAEAGPAAEGIHDGADASPAEDEEEAGTAGPTPTPLGELREGLNRISWDFRGEGLPEVEGLVPFGDLHGHQVAPGAYAVRMKVGDRAQEAPLEVRPDPRFSATAEEYAAQERFLERAEGLARDLYTSVNTLRSIAEQVEDIREAVESRAAADSVVAAADSLLARVKRWEETVIQTKQKTFQDVINFENQLDAQILGLIQSVDGTEPPLTEGARTRLEDLAGIWAERAAERDRILEEDVPHLEALLDRLGLPRILVPPRPNAPESVTDVRRGKRTFALSGVSGLLSPCCRNGETSSGPCFLKGEAIIHAL
ncbi:MAG: WD40/YVTN/BNR-like repeat-containing protein [Gemmatimonadota bacterium]